MWFLMITTFAVASRLIALALAKPVPNLKAGGMSIPLTRHSSFLDSNKSIDLDAVISHGIFIRDKILIGLDNYEKNTGTMHPFAVKRSESELGRRGASIPLTISQNFNMWMGEISIGTPAKTLKVLIDTGAADTWVLETGCDGISGDRDLWDPNSSRSAWYKGNSFRLAYSDGCGVVGNQFTDNITIAGFTADPQTFGSVTKYIYNSRRKEFPADGLLGLAFPSLSKIGVDPLFESLVRQGRLINPTISFKLSSSGAEMYVGGANSMLYHGDITYIPVTHPGFWQISVDDVRLNGNIIFESVPVIFDTGSSHIFGDWNRVAELYRRLDGTLLEHGDFGFYYLPCDSFPTLSFTFGGKMFKIPPEVLRLGLVERGSSYCFSGLIAQRWRAEFWNIGFPFLQGVYTVLDYGTRQIGFADLV